MDYLSSILKIQNIRRFLGGSDPKEPDVWSGETGVIKLKSSKVGYKQVLWDCPGVYSGCEAIATLIIPEGAKVVRPKNGDQLIAGMASDKLRTDKAFVQEIVDSETGAPIQNGRSIYDREFKYEVGEMVVPESGLNTDIEEECTSGIYFFPDINKARGFFQLRPKIRDPVDIP